MKFKITILVILLCFQIQSFSQLNPGARQIAIAHTDISFSNDVFSIFNNPAGLSKIKQREVGLFYSPAMYGIKELSNAFGSYIEPTNIGVFSAGFMVYGFELYKQTKFAICYSRIIAEKFSIGLTSIYNNLSIANYGSKGIIIFNVGGTAEVTSTINLGFVIENITRASINEEDDSIPTSLGIGFGYKPLNELSLFASLRKELNYKPTIGFGTEYFLMKIIYLRIGTSSEPKTFSGGIGISYSLFQFNYAVVSHNDLGLTHQFDLIIRFNK